MSSPYIPFYTSDFLGGTGGMTAATKGVYITLLCLMYEAEEPLPQKWDVLARRCGCTLPAFKKAVEALEDDTKIIIEDGAIWSEKCEKHIKQRRERSDSARAAAKIRHEKSKQKQHKPNATAPNPQCDSNANHSHSHNQNIEDTNVSLQVAPANDISSAVSRYNDAAVKAGWPQVQKMTPNRSKQLRARLKECDGMDGWEIALRKAFDSDFCRGRTSKPWGGFGFDWLVKSANFTKLMEGNYDNRHDNARASGGISGGRENRIDPALEQISRLAGLR